VAAEARRIIGEERIRWQKEFPEQRLADINRFDELEDGWSYWENGHTYMGKIAFLLWRYRDREAKAQKERQEKEAQEAKREAERREQEERAAEQERKRRVREEKQTRLRAGIKERIATINPKTKQHTRERNPE
jgi:DNA anti-recombination protein RmuC